MTIQFQIIDWYSYDQDVETNLECIINVFGKTDNDESISCKITGFKPFYYIKVSSDFNKTQYNEMIKI
jgi:hypothetical protein